MFTLYQNFAALYLKNYPFFLISRLPLKNYPFLRESGYERGIRFDRELGGPGIEYFTSDDIMAADGSSQSSNEVFVVKM